MGVTDCSIPPVLDPIYQGNTGPILQPRPTVLVEGEPLDANWTCHIGANYKDGTVAVPKTEITDKTTDNLRWIAALTPTQTDAIDLGSLSCVEVDLIIEVTNLTVIPPFKIETHYTLPVKKQGMI